MTIPRNRLIALAGLAGVLTLLVALVVVPSGSARASSQQLAAALAQGLNCTKTDKANGGFTLDCDPLGATPSPTSSSAPTSSSPSSTPTGDRTPPSTPTGLTASPRSPTSLLITWAASTDNVGVTGYVFERGTTVLGTTTTPDWLDTGLTADTAYTYRVRARDAAGNLSSYSVVLSARTPMPGNCQANPGACGFPDALSTGPTAPLATSARTQFTTAGETIANARITGCAEIRANNVTFRNVEFAANGSCFWRIQNFAVGLQLIDSYISCAGSNNNGIGSTGLSLLRVEITGCENGLNVAGTTTVTDSWIHDLVTANGAHTDGAQINQGAADILFQHNTIIVPTPGSTSAIIMWNEGDPQNARVTIANNLLAGGTYTLYCGRSGAVNNIRITGNRFGTFQYGYADHCGDGEVWTGNVRDSDGAPLAAQ